MDYSSIIESAGKQYNVDPALLTAMMGQESAGNPNAVSPKGATGLMQLMPATAKQLGVSDIADPMQNIHAGAKYMSQQLDKYGTVPLALAAYNAGPGAVDKHGGIPPYPETQDYVKKITGNYQSVQGKPMANSVDPFTDLVMSGGLAAQAADQAAPDVDPFAGLMLPKSKQTYTYTDETNNPNYKPDPNELHIDISGVGAKSETADTVDPFAGLMLPKDGAKQPQRSFLGDIGHQLGLTVRGGVSGVAGLPLMAGDAANSILNLLPGVNLQMPSRAAQDLMDKSGIAKPETPRERIVQDVVGGMSGAGGFIQSGKALLKNASPIISGIGNTMSTLPGMQILGSAGSGAAGGSVREDGGGVGAQLVAGVLGGGAGVLGSSLLTSAPRILGGTVNNIKGAVQPWTNPDAYVGTGLAAKVGPDAAVVANRIRNTPEYVANSLPTAAEAGGGSTLVATQKAASNLFPDIKTQIADRGASNNAARWNALNDVARSEDELSIAQTSRGQIMGPAYEAAHTNQANVGPAFMKYAQIPEMQAAMEDANKIASLDAAVGRGVPPVWPTPDSKAINGSALDYTSRALGDQISAAKRAGLTTKAGSLSILKDKVDSWMGQYIPGVAAARSDYSALSQPINTMEAGQQIQNALGTRANDINQLPQITLDGYRSALTKAIKDQKFGIDPQAHEQLQGIGQDLQRASTANSLKTPGADTAYNLAANGWLARSLYGNEFQGGAGWLKSLAALGAGATGHLAVAGGLLAGGNKIGTMTGANLQKSLGGLLLNPTSLLPYLDAAAKQSPKALPSSLGRNINQGLLGAFIADRASPGTSP